MKKDYVQLVADLINKNYDEVQAEMNLVKEKFGITFAEYYNNKFYELSPNQQAIKVRVVNYKRNQRENNFQKVMSATGLNKKEINQNIKNLNSKYGLKMTIGLYAKFEVYRYQGEALDQFIDLYKRRRELIDQLKADLTAIDEERITYQDIRTDLEEFYQIVDKTMTDSLAAELEERILACNPDLKNDPDACRSVVVDMEATRVLLGFTIVEYLCFDFAGKTLEEKKEYINDKERLAVLKTINDASRLDQLDDKYQAYKLLGEYYKRDMIQIKSDADYKDFEKFCKKHKTLVIKPHNYSFGKGVKPLFIDDSTDIKNVFDELTAEYTEFLIEECIVAHKKMKRLNPDSVNTVRVITYFNGSSTMVHNTFMKIGRKGSFVDNGGAGGILVSIDPKTGRFNSDGYDEKGIMYECHPDSGLKFRGFKLPRWKKALKLAMEMAPKVPGICYIGWDLTYTEKEGWVVVEGNAKTQFIGQQCTLKRGMRKEFLELVGYNKE